MRRWLRFLISSVFVFPLITLILSLVFWFYGPLLGETHPFEAVLPRVIVIAILWLFVLLLMLIIHLVRNKKDRKLTEDISEQVAEEDPADEAVKAELGDVREKLRAALIKLRKSKMGRRHLNEMPWYVMIGPPGAGKTTAIVNSGLQFPLADELGKGAIGGVGGTRNCDWWFTENAVLIDTAGRYTTQESDATTDNAGWLGFLSLLKKHRKRQPINGAMVAISLSDLSLQDETTQMAHAKAVRRRLHELREKLGVRFPVYVIFTKADLIAGFTEYFDDLGKEEREQVWGFTLPLDKSRGEKSPVASFDEEFGALLGQLNLQLLERMQAETDHQRRSLIQGFPGQVASLREIAKRFLAEVFVDNRYEKRHMLRGVYFTSGTQEGTPIDRLMMGMAKTFGLGRQAIGSGQGTGRSFFLTRLFEGVIFKEAGLVSADDKVERRYKWAVRGAIAATLIFAIAAGTFWTRSFLANRKLIADVEQRVTLFQEQASLIPGNPIADTDLPGIVDALNTLRDVPVNPTALRLLEERDEAPEDRPDKDGKLGYGLYQGDRLGNEVNQAYRAALNEIFLPRLLLRLEDQIAANMNQPELLYEVLKTYLVLGQQGPMNTDLIKQFMTIDWELAFQGPGRAQLREDLAFHLDALLSAPMDEISLNGPLIEQAQGVLAKLPLAQRVYNGILVSKAATELPEFRISNIGGPNVGRVMTRSSGKPLSEGIPGIYTYDGFNDVFLREAVGVAERVQKESFVLGEAGEGQQDEAKLIALSRDVLDLYYDDFIKQYEALLGDLDIVPMEDLARAVEVTQVLSGPTSPIVNILNAISQETKLTEERDQVDAEKVGEGLLDVAKREITEDLSVTNRRILGALKNAQGADGQPQKPPGAPVEERFAFLHNLVDASAGPSQLDELMASLTLVSQELNKLAFRGQNAPITDIPALISFRQAASRIEGPLERWATQIGTGSSGLAAAGNRASIDAAWKANVLPTCQAATSVYPFNRRAAAELGMADFQRVFGPDGMIDKFFKESLEPFVDTNTRPWTFKKVNDTDLGISPAVLAQFELAAEIRAAFFPTGPTPSVSFQITPAALDPKAEAVVLEIDGQSITFTHRDGQPSPTGFTWPGSVGLGRVSLTPPLNGVESVLNKDGPWGWFRLLDSAEVRNTNAADRKRLIFNVGGRIAIFQLQTSSLVNPFGLAALSKFKCPESF
ncbi:type VI secretion system membrane subunit TssM [Frigidibacter sp. ROC022]|uniref:type VI secretion system membrane subunit TssM n=1 Tax=Frigidibacter sp. ROC022 TaxID=2971796 RepID=UPI00215A6443|nr:type VI secretion system membrane subunit TssM [Frigidibacter sp. ROC022]MCR8723340.1 type VI secretion system membrane subunit TssM [Frigidibacter sp. ROC022]